MSNFVYYQRTGGNEPWRAHPAQKVADLKEVMFVTALSIDSAVSEEMNKQELDALRYKGPLYFDLDAKSPASTASKALELIAKLKEEDVNPDELMVYISGGKGFHILVPEECFLLTANKKGIPFLPAIYKELAFKFAVDSMDFRVYTARKGRMLRQANVLRPENGMYKVRISLDELVEITTLANDDENAANELYRTLASAPRPDIKTVGSLAGGLSAAYDAAVNKVSTSAKKKKPSKIVLPKELPSFEMLLEGLGIKEDAGFHNLAMQIAIMAHARKMTKEQLVEDSKGLCEKHTGDGGRYNTFDKRQAELVRMFLYMEDNPCYEYAPNAVKALLTHDALDLQGIDMTREEIQEAIDNPELNEDGDGEYGHAGVTINRKGVFSPTESGLKQICALSFDKVIELTSVEDNQVQSLEADIIVGGRMTGRKTIGAADFNSVNAINKFTMGYGQAFNGTDSHARGTFMRVVEKARKGGNRMYATRREGLDLIQIPFAEQEELRKPFLVWTDAQGVKTSKEIQETGVQFRFVGFPDPQGSYQTDLSLAPDLAEWAQDSENKELLRQVVKAAMHCQHPKHVGKWLGWNVACHYRMLFHSVYSKFPLLHVNGAAGQGKCLAKGTEVLLASGETVKVEDIRVGDKLLSPTGAYQNVTSLASGQEMMWKVTPVKGDAYTVNESHILSLKRSNKGLVTLKSGRRIDANVNTLSINVKEFYENEHVLNKMFKGWRNEIPQNFDRDDAPLEVEPYWFGAWLGDGKHDDVTIYKPECNMTKWLYAYAEKRGLKVSKYEGATCPGWAIVAEGGGRWGVHNPLRSFINNLGGKHIPDNFKYAKPSSRLLLLAGLMDADGSLADSGYDYISKSEQLADDVCFLARSVGLAAYKQECIKRIKSVNFEGTYYRVHISGDCDIIPCRDKKAAPRQQIKRVTVTGIRVKPVGVGEYYGFTLDGDHLFMLGDFTVTHNTESTKLFANLHYYNGEPKMLTPSSSLFAVTQAVAASASIPMILDEFKPSEMAPQQYERFKLILRDAYNCRNVERGGGNQHNSDYRSIHQVSLSAPMCFIAEAAESETAVMERVVLLTLTRGGAVQMQEYRKNFEFAVANRHVLGILGQYLAASVLQDLTKDAFKEEFDLMYNKARKALMLQEDDFRTLEQDEIQVKAAAKERTVYNYTVMEFGLRKLQQLVDVIFPGEFDDEFNGMYEHMYNTMEELRQQTMPEWLKVFNTFSILAKEDGHSKLVKGEHYDTTSSGSKELLVISLRAAYHRYRVYCSSIGEKALYSSEAAFILACNNLHVLEEKNVMNHDALEAPGGVHVFDLNGLRVAGFIDFI